VRQEGVGYHVEDNNPPLIVRLLRFPFAEFTLSEIPAFAGMTGGEGLRASAHRNDGGFINIPPCVFRVMIKRFFAEFTLSEIPAFAGMTGGEGLRASAHRNDGGFINIPPCVFRVMIERLLADRFAFLTTWFTLSEIPAFAGMTGRKGLRVIGKKGLGMTGRERLRMTALRQGTSEGYKIVLTLDKLAGFVHCFYI
jgi:hypothetical protein